MARVQIGLDSDSRGMPILRRLKPTADTVVPRDTAITLSGSLPKRAVSSGVQRKRAGIWRGATGIDNA